MYICILVCVSRELIRMVLSNIILALLKFIDKNKIGVLHWIPGYDAHQDRKITQNRIIAGSVIVR